MDRVWSRLCEHVRPGKRFRPLWVAVALVGGLALLVLTIQSAQASSVAPVRAQDAPGGIRGVLYQPNGSTPVPGGWIDIHDAQGHPWMGVETAPDGSFSIPNLSPGAYTLIGHPPPDSPFASSLPHPAVVASGQWTQTTLRLTTVGISGWVRDSGTGAPIPGAVVVAHRNNWSEERWSGTNISGEFKIGGVVNGVTYALEVLPPPGSEYVQLPVPYTAVPVATGLVLEMHIPPTNVVGVVHNDAGAAVPGAGVVLFHGDFWRETAANALGEFLFRGLPAGTFTIQAAPPWGPHGAGLLPGEPRIITVHDPPAVTDVGVMTLPRAVKRATGRVVFVGTDDPVADAVVRAHRLDAPGFADTPVDAMGRYTLSLPGGEWHLDAIPLHPPAGWVFNPPPAWIAFTQPVSIPETIADVVLGVIPTNAWVEGRVVCPPPGCPPDLEPREIRVEVRNEEIGNGAELQAGYAFEIPIPDGWYELIVHVNHPMFQGPGPVPVFVGPGQRLNVGDIVLWPKDASIIGMVRDQLGHPVPDVRVAGWQPEASGWGWAETDASGVYTMHVIPGEWFVEPHPAPDMPWIHLHPPRLVRVAPRGTMAGVDFVLAWADSRIRGAAVDAGDGHRLWGLDGWATAWLLPQGDLLSDAPLRDGGFELKAIGNETYEVGLHLPPYAPYVSGSAGPIPVGPAETVTAVVPLMHKDAGIEGRLVVAGTTNPALGIRAEVLGQDEGGHWTHALVDPHTAGYGMAVVSGTWHLRAWADPESGYVAVPTPTIVTAQSGQPPVQLDLEVWPIAASISGQVLKPDSSPQPGAFVFAEGESPFVGYFETFVRADDAGHFMLRVPAGTYRVGAGLPPRELEKNLWLPPPPIAGVHTSPATPVTNLVLRFRQLDGRIEGTIGFAAGLDVTPTHPAYVWGWANTGEWMETLALTNTADTFTYSLPVLSGKVWHVGAVYEDPHNGQFYESAEALVDLTGGSHAVQDLTLAGPYTMPQPFIVSFDGRQMQTIIMPDGVELSIPGGAIYTGTVTLFIFPTHEMQPEPGHEIVGPGYEMWAVNDHGQQIVHFNQNVMLTFGYPPDAVLAARGVQESTLIPVYYSTLVGQWILADRYVVDTVHNQVVLQISHFTKFGLASSRIEYRVYLPVVLKYFRP